MAEENINAAAGGVNPADYNVNLTNPEMAMTIASGEVAAPAPKVAPKSDFASAMRQSDAQLMDEIFNPQKSMTSLEKLNAPVGPKTAYAGADLDIYRYQEDFDPRGFDPFDSSNYQRFTEAETWGSALAKGFDSFGSRFGNTFSDYWKDYGRMFDALINWDSSLLQPDEDQMINLNYEEHRESMKNYVFMDPSQDDDIFSKRSLSEFVGNAGFALGTFAGLGVELVADALITIGTAGGGIGTFAATAGRFTAKMGLKSGAKAAAKEAGKEATKQAGKSFVSISNILSDMNRGYNIADQSADALKVAKQIRQAEDVAEMTRLGKVSDSMKTQLKEVFEVFSMNMGNILKSRSFGDFALQVGKGVPLLGTGVRYGEKIAMGAKGGLSGATLTGIGLRGFRRMAQEFNMSATEAAFEGISTFGDTLDMMVKQYQADHDGQNPSAAELLDMKELATQASFANYKTNFALLAASNKLQFGNLFNKFSVSNIWARELLEEGAEKTLGVKKMFVSSAIKSTGKVYEKGFFGTYGLTGQIAKDFGKKQAAYEFGKAFLKDFGRFEVLEGLQENLQETSNSAWKNYYAGLYNGTKYTLAEAFEEGLGEQFTKQGLKTFLQGALTGSIIRMPTALTSKVIEGAQKKAMDAQYKNDPTQNPFVQAEAQRKKDINLVNELLMQMGNKKFEDSVVNFNTQTKASTEMTEAAAKGNEYEWTNAKDNSVLAGALAANRLGLDGIYTASVREMGTDMTNDEFKAQFGVDISETKYATVSEFAQDMARDVEKYSKTMDNVRKKVKNMVDPLMYEKDSKERIIATMMYNAQEDAVRIIAMNQLKGARASERAEKVAKDLMSIKELANSSEYILRAMSTPKNLEGEIGNIAAEIKILQESLKVEGIDPKTKKETEERIKLKKEEQDLLNKWYSYWSVREDLVDVEIDDPDAPGKKKKEKVARKVPDTFVGKTIKEKVEERNHEGKVVAEHDTQYDLYNEEVAQTLKKLVNLRNKQAGLDTQLSEEAAKEAVVKMVDFVRLDQDARDYMQSVDALFNPKYLQETMQRMADGRFKAELIGFVEEIGQRITAMTLNAYNVKGDPNQLPVDQIIAIMNTISKVEKAIYESDAYKNLLMLVVDDNLGIQHTKIALDAVDQITKVIKDTLNDTFGKQRAVLEDATDSEYEDFKKGVISDSTKMTIANKIFAEMPLGPRHQEMYDSIKEEIDGIVKDLISKIQERRKAKGTKTYEGPATQRMSGRIDLLMRQNDDRLLEDILEYYDMEDGEVAPLKEVVEKAINSPFIHPLVKEALLGFLPYIKSDQTLRMNSKRIYSPAAYNLADNMIEMDPHIADNGLPFEAILLHEMVHAVTSRELESAPNGFFATEVKRLYDETIKTLEAQGVEVFDAAGVPILYGFKDVHEFLAEAYSSPAFQKMLQSVPSQGGQSAWEAFISKLIEFLKKAFNIDMERSVLDDIFQIVENHINNSPALYAKQKLVEQGLTQEDFDTMGMNSNDMINLALREGLVTVEELRQLTQPKDPIDYDTFMEFVDTGEIAPSIIESIAEKIANGERLSPREQAVRDANGQTIENILLEKATSDPLNSEEMPEYTVQEIEGQGFTAISAGKTFLENADGSTMMFPTENDLHAYMNRLFAPKKEDSENVGENSSNSTENQKQPEEEKDTFSVEGNESDGYKVVVTASGIAFPEVFKTMEEAEIFISERMNTIADIDFATSFMGDLAEFEEPVRMLDSFISRAKRSLAAYNKRNDSQIETLEDYFRIPEGSETLDMIKESVLTNIPLTQIKKERKRLAREKKKAEVSQPSLFNALGSTSDTGAGPAVSITQLDQLRNLALQVLKSQDVQEKMSEKSGKFVGEESTKKATEEEVYKDLEDILGCF